MIESALLCAESHIKIFSKKYSIKLGNFPLFFLNSLDSSVCKAQRCIFKTFQRLHIILFNYPKHLYEKRIHPALF